VVTAPTIGLFLLALALGYHSGSRVAADYRAVVARNFLISAALMGGGLAAAASTRFSPVPNPRMAYLVFIGGILCPLAWLLGQTVPILTNLMLAQRSGEAAGRALYWSTLGSFLGSVTLSLAVMQVFGVWAAVLLGSLMLVAGAGLVQRPGQAGDSLDGGNPGAWAWVSTSPDRQRIGHRLRRLRSPAGHARRHAGVRVPSWSTTRMPR
jgi:hypothetical protein